MDDLISDIERIARLRGMSFDEVRAAKDAHMAAMAAHVPKTNTPAPDKLSTAVGVYVDMEIYDELPERSRRFLQNAPSDLCAADWRKMLGPKPDDKTEARVIRGAVRMLATRYGHGPGRDDEQEWRAPSQRPWLGMARATG